MDELKILLRIDVDRQENSEKTRIKKGEEIKEIP